MYYRACTDLLIILSLNLYTDSHMFVLRVVIGMDISISGKIGNLIGIKLIVIPKVVNYDMYIL